MRTRNGANALPRPDGLRASLALVAFAAVVFITAPALPAADYVIVGARNIEHHGHRAAGQRPIALAEHITLAGVDVLALQEIHDTDEDESTFTNSALDSVLPLLNEGGTADWAYVLFPKRSRESTSQLTGIMWNKKRVQSKGDSFRLAMEDPRPDDDVRPWDRWATAMKFGFGDKTDFVVIPLHMKANVDGEDFGREQRGIEAKMLVDQLDDVKAKFADQDIVLIGDTNFKPNESPAAKTFVDAGFRDLNAGEATTFVRGTNAPFDRIFVPKGQREFQFMRQYVLTATQPEQHEEYLSDHYMIVAAIKVMNDDD
jgi:endonuclease/exonuclease/phosphatase family metal-dependent hydrolase